ncbi:hypothetical protein MGA3_01325 [Bacillus methanolicus MGA3]|nr:hypothetical protein MGA3_01325 [Bacillus methanolicus MGA3]
MPVFYYYIMKAGFYFKKAAGFFDLKESLILLN